MLQSMFKLACLNTQHFAKGSFCNPQTTRGTEEHALILASNLGLVTRSS